MFPLYKSSTIVVVGELRKGRQNIMIKQIGNLNIWEDNEGYFVSTMDGTEMGDFDSLSEAIDYCEALHPEPKDVP
jgi:hypothetical protein